MFALGCIRTYINKVREGGREGKRRAGGVWAVHKQHHVAQGWKHPVGVWLPVSGKSHPVLPDCSRHLSSHLKQSSFLFSVPFTYN